VEDYLYKRMIYIGKNRIHYSEIDSTNSELKRLFSTEEIVEGTLLTTNFQSSGQGQRGKGWESALGANFLGTYLLTPNINPREVFILNIIASLAVKETITELTQLEVSIKWPNDIVVNGAKIAGILVDNKILASKVVASFIGIGLNLNQLKFSNFSRSATSVRKLIDKKVEIEAVVEKLNFHIQQFYSLYKLKGFETLNFLYHQDLYLKGDKHLYEVETGIKEFILQSVSKEGRLQLFNHSGEIEVFGIKEITFLK
jgi:BirA family biotin operon repressor/biotin-[acetyl-CoA-carboxylase] ligase|tara:strand:- start:3360 stop:4127 length:768 start_codon:yes stop_codon:yes gene_type:complete